jgi:hypothetical protein
MLAILGIALYGIKIILLSSGIKYMNLNNLIILKILPRKNLAIFKNHQATNYYEKIKKITEIFK